MEKEICKTCVHYNIVEGQAVFENALSASEVKQLWENQFMCTRKEDCFITGIVETTHTCPHWDSKMANRLVDRPW